MWSSVGSGYGYLGRHIIEEGMDNGGHVPASACGMFSFEPFEGLGRIGLREDIIIFCEFYPSFEDAGRDLVYGIMWNTRYLKAKKIPVPKEWDDLKKPVYQ